MDIMIRKVTFEKPKGWQFKNRNYKKFKEIIIGAQDQMTSAKSHITNPEEAVIYYLGLFKKNGYKNPTKILNKIKELYTIYFDRLSGGGGNTGIYEDIILEEAREFNDSDASKATETFGNIYGVGPAKIKKLVEHEIYTIEQLRYAVSQDPKTLNNKQKMGLAHYEDLNERIPRNEITKFRKAIAHLLKINYKNDIQMTIAGSYRRGIVTSGDMDMLISSQKYESKALGMVLELLENTGMICEVLAKGFKKFMGIVRVGQDGKARHLDIVETTPEDYPFAMLYFTGSAQHNVQMRGHALTLGYSLNEYNMTLKGTNTRVPSEVVEEKIGKPVFETEEDIFKFLELDYKEPRNRITL
jgi:DNA polymerase/3'-5' exonuclease PolX